MTEMRRRRLMAGAAVVLPCRAAFGQSDNMRAFRDQVLQILRREYPDVPAQPGPDDGSIAIGPSILNLDNMHATARLLPAADREAAIVDFLARMMEGRDRADAAKDLPWSEAKDVLRVRLVSAQYFPPGAEVLRRPFAPGVVVAYAIDHGRQVQFASMTDRENWKVDPEQVHQTAIANLETLSGSVSIDIVEARGGGRFAAIATSDSYDAARLALPRFRARLLAALGEPMFVGIPNRDFLVAWSASNAMFSTFVTRVADDFRKQPYAITSAIFRVDREGARPATAAERRGR
jgi:hypothetical protein